MSARHDRRQFFHESTLSSITAISDTVEGSLQIIRFAENAPSEESNTWYLSHARIRRYVLGRGGSIGARIKELCCRLFREYEKVPGRIHEIVLDRILSRKVESKAFDANSASLRVDRLLQ
jgi:hypothetical protein